MQNNVYVETCIKRKSVDTCFRMKKNSGYYLPLKKYSEVRIGSEDVYKGASAAFKLFSHQRKN